MMNKTKKSSLRIDIVVYKIIEMMKTLLFKNLSSISSFKSFEKYAIVLILTMY